MYNFSIDVLRKFAKRNINTMGLFSSLFSDDKNGRIHALKSRIESEKLSIAVARDNMAHLRAQKAPRHYQDAGRKKIEYHKQLIAKYRAEIDSLKRK